MFLTIIKKIYRGQSLARVLMNLSFKDFEVSGLVVDVGGGRRPDYFSYFNTKRVSKIVPLDGSIDSIDFEKDRLNYDDNSVDTVVLCNVLEHIFNHNFLVSEIYRILKNDSALVGFVPFMVNYHPDPNDYFRYTKDALFKIFSNSGFKDINIKTVGSSSFYVNYNNIMLSFPKFIRPALFLPYYVLDKVFCFFRPNISERYPLGYTFYARK